MGHVKTYRYLLAVLVVVMITIAPTHSYAGNVGWSVSVGGGYSGWRPVPYGPVGWGPWGPAWRGGWAYRGYYGYPYGGYYPPYAPPVVAYVPPPQQIIWTAQPQPAVWYFCEASNQYYPYVTECSAGWQIHPAVPPQGEVKPHDLQPK